MLPFLPCLFPPGFHRGSISSEFGAEGPFLRNRLCVLIGHLFTLAAPLNTPGTFVAPLSLLPPFLEIDALFSFATFFLFLLFDSVDFFFQYHPGLYNYSPSKSRKKSPRPHWTLPLPKFHGISLSHLSPTESLPLSHPLSSFFSSSSFLPFRPPPPFHQAIRDPPLGQRFFKPVPSPFFPVFFLTSVSSTAIEHFLERPLTLPLLLCLLLLSFNLRKAVFIASVPPRLPLPKTFFYRTLSFPSVYARLFTPKKAQTLSLLTRPFFPLFRSGSLSHRRFPDFFPCPFLCLGLPSCCQQPP